MKEVVLFLASLDFKSIGIAYYELFYGSLGGGDLSDEVAIVQSDYS